MVNITSVVSNTKAIAKVEKQVRICLACDFTMTHGELHFDFDMQLSRRGTDFRLYANTGYVENVHDSDLLVAIANSLDTPRSGLKTADVKACSLEVNFSASIPSEEMIQRILDAAHGAGYMVSFRNMDKEKRERRGF